MIGDLLLNRRRVVIVRHAELSGGCPMLTEYRIQSTDRFSIFATKRLVIETGLMEGDIEFTIYSGENTLDLTEGEHTSEEGVTGIVTV